MFVAATGRRPGPAHRIEPRGHQDHKSGIETFEGVIGVGRQDMTPFRRDDNRK
jgi:hypothetical protein